MSTSSFTMPFAGNDLNACEHERDPKELQAFLNDPKAKAMLLDRGRPALLPEGGLKWVKPNDLIGQNIADPGPLFLGKQGDVPVFAFSISTENALTEIESFQDMRVVAAQLSPMELALAGQAKSLFDWHDEHRFCAKCGAGSRGNRGGTTRQCDSCGAAHFPRVNPVTIMLVINGDDCLLGRGHGWPEGSFSALAGFVSPGETIEEGCAREIFEEVGVTIKSPRYVFSQPWPFPSQLMIGLICETDDRELVIDANEIEDARWFSRDEVEAVFAKRSDAFKRPPRFTIAHQLLRHWLKEG
ncbi:NAD(+) diphosphatase [Fretibacter rubidus]|uniref:NAD(+) diphosphatase n=1 Tax=Fretibacter rubidus TaxID=570162 RepID=UPI00352A710B